MSQKGEFGKNCFNLQKSQIWTILNRVMGSYLCYHSYGYYGSMVERKEKAWE